MSFATKDVISVPGISGTQYTFEVYPKSYSWNSAAGVYLVLHRNIQGGYDPIYVGETSDLGDRFQDHHKANCFERHKWTHLAFLHERSEPRRLVIEADLLGRFDWPCNS